ncbi:MAG: phage baseplate protein [Polyangia bacterium]
MLTASDMLRAWERGEGRSQLERAVLLLECGRASLGDRAAADLWSLPIGTRDGLLLTLREQTFGPSLRGHALCPACGQKLGFAADTRGLRIPPDRLPAPAAPGAPHQLRHDGWELGFRLLTSRDLQRAAALRHPEAARDELLRCCLLEVRHDGAELPVGGRPQLPPAITARLLAALAAHDPQAEVLLSLGCPGCGHAFATGFDIASFFFAEVAVEAQRLLDEVSTLARAFGWCEADILELSPLRRRHYLDRVGHG